MRKKDVGTVWSVTRHRGLLVCAVFLMQSIPCNADSLDLRLKALREQYQAVSSVRFEADMDTVFLSSNRSLFTTYGYWGQGERYRTDLFATNESHTKRKEMISIAYNGERFQRLDLKDSFLNYCRGDRSVTPSLSPNPALSPVRFLLPYVANAEEDGVHLRFKDLSSDELWSKAAAHTRVVQGADAGGPMVVEFLGQNGGDVCYEVRFGDHPNHMPTQVIELSEIGKAIVKIGEYYPVELNGKMTYWPQSITTDIVVSGVPGAHAQVTVKPMEFNEEPPPGVFDLDFTRASLVWDDDLKVAVKHPSGDVPLLGMRDPHRNSESGVPSHATNHSQDIRTGAAISHSPVRDESKPRENEGDVSASRALSNATRPSRRGWVYPILMMLLSGITLFYLWHRNHTPEKGASRSYQALDEQVG